MYIIMESIIMCVCGYKWSQLLYCHIVDFEYFVIIISIFMNCTQKSNNLYGFHFFWLNCNILICMVNMHVHMYTTKMYIFRSLNNTKHVDKINYINLKMRFMYTCTCSLYSTCVHKYIMHKKIVHVLTKVAMIVYVLDM